MNQEKTTVIFRTWKDTKTVIALFPGMNYESGDTNRGMCMSYEQIGQHGEADYDGVIRGTVPSEQHEYEDLHLELVSLGYDLDVRTKKPVLC